MPTHHTPDVRKISTLPQSVRAASLRCLKSPAGATPPNGPATPTRPTPPAKPTPPSRPTPPSGPTPPSRAFALAAPVSSTHPKSSRTSLSSQDSAVDAWGDSLDSDQSLTLALLERGLAKGRRPQTLARARAQLHPEFRQRLKPHFLVQQLAILALLEDGVNLEEDEVGATEGLPSEGFEDLGSAQARGQRAPEA